MDKQLQDRWVAKLRSGEYSQGTGALRGTTEDGILQYCCLGVLLDVAGKQWEPLHADAYAYGVRVPDGQGDEGEDVRYGSLGMFLRDELGISLSAEAKLIAMNDDTPASFLEIADWIEGRDLDTYIEPAVGVTNVDE